MNYIGKKEVWYSGISCVIVASLNFLNYFLNFLPATGNATYLELNFLYTPEKIYSLADQYGEVGRELYISSALSMDLLVPFSASLFLTCLTIYLYKKNFSNPNISKGIIALGILACLSDWTENILLVTALKLYPKQNYFLVTIAGTATMFKYAAMVGFVIVISIIIYRIKSIGKSK